MIEWVAPETVERVEPSMITEIGWTRWAGGDFVVMWIEDGEIRLAFTDTHEEALAKVRGLEGPERWTTATGA